MAQPRKARSPVDRIMVGADRYVGAWAYAERLDGRSTDHVEVARRWRLVDQAELRLKRLVQRVLREARAPVCKA